MRRPRGSLGESPDMINGRDIARITRTFRLELGPLRARGVPALVLATGGLVIAGGLARLIAQNPVALAETIRESARFVGLTPAEKPTIHLNKPA